MATKDCRNFDKCDAPMCPLDGCSGPWYPLDDEICKSRTHGNIDWVLNQKKIANKTVNGYTYYTIRMLERNCKITKGITGLDPDLTIDKEEREVEKWLKKHPEKKEKTKEEKDEIRNRLNQGLSMPKK